MASTTLRDLARGEYLCYQGETVRSVFTLVCGRVTLCTNTSDGKQVPLYTVRAGECVAEAALFAERYCSDVVAETSSRVRAFPVAALKKTLADRSDLAMEFMALQAKRCNTLRVNLELRSLRSARERILQYLQRATVPETQAIALDRPLKNIADDLGLTHESFYRTMSHLVNEGLVIRTGKVVRLRCVSGEFPHKTGDETGAVRSSAVTSAGSRPAFAST